MISPGEVSGLVRAALESGDYGEAIRLCSFGLNSNPDNVFLLVLLGKSYMDGNRFYDASVVLEKALGMDDKFPGAWGAVAQCYAEMAAHTDIFYDKAIAASQKAIDGNPDDSMGYVTMSFADLMKCNYDRAYEYAQKGLKVSGASQSKAAMFNMAIAMLANHMWEDGWFCYDRTLAARYLSRGNAKPGIPDYGLPLWDGSAAKVLIAGEQGLGDELMFSSMIPDIQKDTGIVIDCDPKLDGLFERSFRCETHGTKYADDAPWKKLTDAKFWLPMGSLGAFYRSKAEDFPRRPYLVADPQRRIQWRALLDSISGKPKVGIAWSGGMRQTGEIYRSLSIPELAPILDYDVEWVSLQYKNADQVPYFMHHWPQAVQGSSYDDTAALIAELDLVISVQTSVVHCAGALGKETLCLLGNRPQWRYGAFGDEMLWYGSVKLLRQNADGEWPFDQVIDRLERLGAHKTDRRDWDLPPLLDREYAALAMAG
jgi:tetratricopeptide (TPR) repeat protein